MRNVTRFQSNMHAWYDLKPKDKFVVDTCEGIEDSRKDVEQLIQNEVHLIWILLSI